MKNISAKLTIFATTLSFCLVSCSKPISWKRVEKDVAMLKENGFKTFYNNTTEEIKAATASINLELETLDKVDFKVNVVGVYGLTETNYDSTVFVQFENKEQAKNYYELELNRENRKYKIVLAKDIVVASNYDRAIHLLNYSWK